MMYVIIARRMVLRLPIHCNNMHAIKAAGMAPIGGELAAIEIHSALCSRNFQNVKLRLQDTILQPFRFYMKSNFGKFKWSEMSILAILEF